MTRVAFILSICCFTLMFSCTDAPKTGDSLIQEELATTQVNSGINEFTLTVPERKVDVISEVDEPKPVIKKEEPRTSSEPKPKANKTPPVTNKKSVVQPQPVAKSTPKTFAHISFDKTVHEFGEIDEVDKITHKFKFKNTGNGPLIIDNVDVSCGCTMPTYPIMPIGPGETGEIGAVYNSKGKFGTQKPSITIKTNASQPIVKLYLSGSIKHVFEKTTTDTKG